MIPDPSSIRAPVWSAGDIRTFIGGRSAAEWARFLGRPVEFESDGWTVVGTLVDARILYGQLQAGVRQQLGPVRWIDARRLRVEVRA